MLFNYHTLNNSEHIQHALCDYTNIKKWEAVETNNKINFQYYVDVELTSSVYHTVIQLEFWVQHQCLHDTYQLVHMLTGKHLGCIHFNVIKD